MRLDNKNSNILHFSLRFNKNRHGPQKRWATLSSSQKNPKKNSTQRGDGHHNLKNQKDVDLQAMESTLMTSDIIDI